MAGTYTWRRLWSPRSGSVIVADDGFLSEPRSGLFPLNTDLLELEQVADAPCVILLGEPGLGKSFALEDHARRLRATGAHVLLVDLARAQSDVLLRSIILNDPVWHEALASNAPVFLLLDALDEARLRNHAVGHVILGILREVEPGRLRLRITCRFAEWPSKLEGELRKLFGDAGFQVLELAPLRKEEVRAAAEANGLSGDGFLTQVLEREAQPLAACPLTLGFLIQLAQTAEGLPRTQVDLYRRGCLRLAQEHDDDRRDGAVLGQALPAERRLAIAARIAAATLLSGRSAVRLRDAAGAAEEPGVATVSDLVGGKESDIGVAVETAFPVDAAAVRETMQSALFSGRGEGRVGWAHQTYGEFLAALYLTTGSLGPNQIRSLTMTLYDRAWRVVPELREIASWLAVMDPSFFETVLQADPDALLGTSSGDLDHESRRRIVDALIAGAATGRIERFSFSARRLARLKHPGLVAQLASVIGDGGRSLDQRRFAVHLAEAASSG